jgi:hypothetical protein
MLNVESIELESEKSEGSEKKVRTAEPQNHRTTEKADLPGLGSL